MTERPYIVRMTLRFPRRAMRSGRWRARLAVLVVLLGVWLMGHSGDTDRIAIEVGDPGIPHSMTLDE